MDDGDLLKAINKYRVSSNLTALNRTETANCIADSIVGLIKNQSCTNANVVPTPPNNTTLSNYSVPVSRCGLNSTRASRDGLILAACDPALALSNFTSTYNDSLASTRFSDIGIGSEGNWTIVVLLSNATVGVVNRASAALTFSTMMNVVLSLLCFFVLF